MDGALEQGNYKTRVSLKSVIQLDLNRKMQSQKDFFSNQKDGTFHYTCSAFLSTPLEGV